MTEEQINLVVDNILTRLRTHLSHSKD